MYMVALSLEQSAFPDSRKVALDRSVIENVRRFLGRKRQIHLDRVPLIGSNHRSIGAQREALLVTADDDGFELCSSQRFAMASESLEEPIDGNPAVGVEREPDGAWLVAEHET